MPRFTIPELPGRTARTAKASDSRVCSTDTLTHDKLGKEVNHMFTREHRLGWHCIDVIDKCRYCQEEFWVAVIDRTDGKGEYHERKNDQRDRDGHTCDS